MMIIQISFSNERNEGLSVPRKTNLCTFSAEWFSPTKERKLTKFVNFKQFKELVATIKPDVIHLHANNLLKFYVLSRFFLKLNAKNVFF